MAAKGPQAYRTISEAAAELGLAPHVLRFWETRFSFLRPLTRAGGRRYYRPQDLAVLRGLRALLHQEGLSIKAVQALHRDEGVARVVAAGEGAPPPPTPPRPRLSAAARTRLEAVLADLERAKAGVDRLLATRRES